MNKKINKKFMGLTLVELLVGIVVGLVVLSAAGGAMMSYMTAYNQSTQINNLNQNMRALMDLMVREIRRSGYITSDPAKFYELKNNKEFSSVEIFSYDGTNNDCIVFFYNKYKDSKKDSVGKIVKDSNNVAMEDFYPMSNESFGFRLKNKEVQMRKSNGGSGCNWGDGSYEAVSDKDILIEYLDFELEPASCSVSAGATCNRQITITMKGGIKYDKSNPPILQTLVQTIKIRNDKFLSE